MIILDIFYVDNHVVHIWKQFYFYLSNLITELPDSMNFKIRDQRFKHIQLNKAFKIYLGI